MATINGTSAAETKTGTTAADLIYGYGGNDSLYGRAGNDQVWGGLGDDKIWGEAGDDTLRGDDGADTVYGGDGNDLAYGGIGNDAMYGDGGTDRMYGEAGNDILKGGTGIAKLYGGDGIDTLHYAPTSSDIDDIGNYLSTSYLSGETVYIYNNSTDAGLPTKTFIVNPDVNTEGPDEYIQFGTDSRRVEAGYIEGNPDLVVVGSGGLVYVGPDFAGGTNKVTGTDVKDTFYGGYESEVLKGGPGDDTFHIDGGNDLLISEVNDADAFYFGPAYYGTNTTVTGFNGAGVSGGDTVYIQGGSLGYIPTPSISESNGKTTISMGQNPAYGDPNSEITVDAVGLVSGVDYFFL